MKENHSHSFKNWKNATIVVLICVFLFWHPVTRSMVLWLLPLGSGVDDLVFFALLFVAGVLCIVRIIPVKDKLHKIANWLTK